MGDKRSTVFNEGVGSKVLLGCGVAGWLEVHGLEVGKLDDRQVVFPMMVMMATADIKH